MVYLSSTKTYNPRISVFYKTERFNTKVMDINGEYDTKTILHRFSSIILIMKNCEIARLVALDKEFKENKVIILINTDSISEDNENK